MTLPVGIKRLKYKNKKDFTFEFNQIILQ